MRSRADHTKRMSRSGLVVEFYKQHLRRTTAHADSHTHSDADPEFGRRRMHRLVGNVVHGR
jgi:hypothetical protein